MRCMHIKLFQYVTSYRSPTQPGHRSVGEAGSYICTLHKHDYSTNKGLCKEYNLIQKEA